MVDVNVPDDVQLYTVTYTMGNITKTDQINATDEPSPGRALAQVTDPMLDMVDPDCVTVDAIELAE